MPQLTLRSRRRDLIYSGNHETVREAVEQAALKGICLDGIDLSLQDLRGITLDGITLDNALFHGADLSGANLSEASLIGADFTQALLFDTCLAGSDLSCSRFEDTRFGATDISGAVLDDCVFEGPDTFTLDFRSAKSLFQTMYRRDETTCPMEKPPIVIRGLETPIVLLDRHILTNTLTLSIPGRVGERDFDLLTKSFPVIISAAQHRNQALAYIRNNE
jgi:uncharacterized protein YjbI with pentapeptide repeats